MTVLAAVQRELADETARLLATAASLTDADVRAPSLLPGWTRGHVLAHLARNADSHVNLLTWARTGMRTPQYPSQEDREAGIEAGAGRPAAEHVVDLRDSAARLDRAVRTLPEEAWRSPVGGLRPPYHPAWYCLVRRLREVGVHHVDLNAGYGPADWPESFVSRELKTCLLMWPYEQSTISGARFVSAAGEPLDEWSGLGDGPVVEGVPADMLAWLTGRSSGDGVRVVPKGEPVPPPPPWLTGTAPADLPATPPEDY
ncbi:maleylpyruvate isomerase family mycothiol-dependent enzyme [Nonomuraea sp. MCN248]|uniref:Maleylpyruvate isomerase family mycothiol-dependent enzyme n=1 Tax=Nonomuraea corallina TaxID=2989783 RepID=A0ABT4SMN7_9ACTN|nr:maleylpyruvate isomerase family mycothiol-dependent enzyme [Nonomuraea corallina]MDA0638335.1 maleylpyruvate isomerase family mycothiol-dependent enzyme [Nonomuraea corallina]